MSEGNVKLSVIKEKISEICQKVLLNSNFDQLSWPYVLRALGDVLEQGADDVDLEGILKFLRPIAFQFTRECDKGNDLMEPYLAVMNASIAKIEKRRSRKKINTFQLSLLGLFDNDGVACVCPRRCDCPIPEPNDDGTTIINELVSEYCPEHNERPKPALNCPAAQHWFEYPKNP